MQRLPVIAWFAAMAALLVSPDAKAQSRATYEKMVAIHAKANKVPEALVHRVIVRESKYRPDLIGHGGTIGLMQIKLATARGVGYTGDAEGLLDPDTNLTYGVKYLAGAWRAAESNHDRAVQLYASGYYHIAKQQRLARLAHPEAAAAPAPPPQAAAPVKEAAAAPQQAIEEPAEAEPAPTEKADNAVKPKPVPARPKAVATAPASATSAKPAKPTHASKPASGPLVLTPILAKLKSVFTPSPKTTSKTASKTTPKTTPNPSSKPPANKLAEARDRVPRPSAPVTGGANAPQPR